MSNIDTSALGATSSPGGQRRAARRPDEVASREPHEEEQLHNTSIPRSGKRSASSVPNLKRRSPRSGGSSPLESPPGLPVPPAQLRRGAQPQGPVRAAVPVHAGVDSFDLPGRKQRRDPIGAGAGSLEDVSPGRRSPGLPEGFDSRSRASSPAGSVDTHRTIGTTEGARAAQFESLQRSVARSRGGRSGAGRGRRRASRGQPRRASASGHR